MPKRNQSPFQKFAEKIEEELQGWEKAPQDQMVCTADVCNLLRMLWSAANEAE